MKYLILFALLCFISLSYESCISYKCIFNGRSYKPGTILTFTCFQLKCNSTGNWEFTRIIASNCDVCHVADDPHFKTFDSYGSSVTYGTTNYYDWHGTCNYSISQPACEMNSYNTSYGIYGVFEMCSRPAVSCLKNTTYKVDEFTAILISHKLVPGAVVIEINGNLITVPATPGVPFDCNNNYYPVVLWKDGNTVRIVGKDFSIQAATNHMFIYTTDFHLQKIAGLCGFYTDDISDDFQRRDCNAETFIPTFANSWKTLDQKDECVEVSNMIDEQCTNADYWNSCTEIVRSQIDICGSPLDPNDEQNAIENCVKDCCANPDSCPTWCETAGSYICNIGKNSKMQERKEIQG